MHQESNHLPTKERKIMKNQLHRYLELWEINFWFILGSWSVQFCCVSMNSLIQEGKSTNEDYIYNVVFNDMQIIYNAMQIVLECY